MILRALIVLLAILNLGVAAWWLLHSESKTEPAPTAVPGAARLQLLQERTPTTPVSSPAVRRPDSAAREAVTPPVREEARTEEAETKVVATAERCFRIGPFASADRLGVAQAALRSRVLRMRALQTSTEIPATVNARGWRVYLPPAADRAAAAATAERIKAAGFSDYFIVSEGNEANAISLGRFSNEDRAQQHAAALRAAGFPARAEPLGEGGQSIPAQTRIDHWLDVVARAPFDSTAARSVSGAAARETACTTTR